MKSLHRIQSACRLVSCRCRATLHRLRGTRVGRKSGFGSRVRIDRPWTVSIGARTTFEDGVWLKVEADDAQIVIGDHCFFGRGCEIDATISVSVGSRTLIAPNVFITDHNHNTCRSRLISEQGCSGAPVCIEDDVWIGANAVILPGVVISRGAVVAAGAVVNRSIPEYQIWGGVPAKKLKDRRS